MSRFNRKKVRRMYKRIDEKARQSERAKKRREYKRTSAPDMETVKKHRFRNESSSGGIHSG